MEIIDSETPGPSFVVLNNAPNEVAQLDEVDTLSTNNDGLAEPDGEPDEMDQEEMKYSHYKPSSGPPPVMLTEELEAGYKILTGLMAWSLKHVNWPFMDSIENSNPELFESYSLRIKKPMWLKLMKQKFEHYTYTTITDFVADFRLMLENCYHFNGPDHFVSKRAVKLETMLEQKLALLSRNIREKTTIAATSGQKEGEKSGLRRRVKTHVPHNSTLLMNQLREEQIQKKKDRRRQMILDRRAEREALSQEICTWEEEVLYAGQKHHMRAMWEIPQIGLFLFLLQDPLNVGEVMHFELERCFMMPRQSSTLHRIMTSLLSTPFQRMKIDKKTVMSYSVWSAKLDYKLQVWYKIFNDCNQDREKTCLKLGLEEKFFDVVGHRNPLENKKYHELSFYKRVWIMKSLCDHCLHMQETLRDMIELQQFEDQRELVLGTDATGQRYIHFPQFCGADIRVYRQAAFKYPKLEIKPDLFESKRKFPFVYRPPPRKKVKLKKKPATASPVIKQIVERPSPTASPLRSRPSRLRQAPKSVIPLQLLDEMSVSETNSVYTSDSESHVDPPSADEDLDTEEAGPSGIKPGTSGLRKKGRTLRSDLSGLVTNTHTKPDQDIDNRSDGRLSSSSDATLPYCDNSDTNSNASSRPCSRDSSPYPLRSDLSPRSPRSRSPRSRANRSSDVSQESSPCISPADFIPRRSARLDRSCEVSRDPSPLIFDTNFGLRRGRRRGTGLKTMPPYNAVRDLTSFLYDENSASNSSMGGENSLSGVGASFWQEKLAEGSRRSSADTGDDSSNFCDISKLFSNSKPSVHSDNGENGVQTPGAPAANTSKKGRDHKHDDDISMNEETKPEHHEKMETKTNSGISGDERNDVKDNQRLDGKGNSSVNHKEKNTRSTTPVKNGRKTRSNASDKGSNKADSDMDDACSDIGNETNDGLEDSSGKDKGQMESITADSEGLISKHSPTLLSSANKPQNSMIESQYSTCDLSERLHDDDHGSIENTNLDTSVKGDRNMNTKASLSSVANEVGDSGTGDESRAKLADNTSIESNNSSTVGSDTKSPTTEINNGIDKHDKAGMSPKNNGSDLSNKADETSSGETDIKADEVEETAHDDASELRKAVDETKAESEELVRNINEVMDQNSDSVSTQGLKESASALTIKKVTDDLSEDVLDNGDGNESVEGVKSELSDVKCEKLDMKIENSDVKMETEEKLEIKNEKSNVKTEGVKMEVDSETAGGVKLEDACEDVKDEVSDVKAKIKKEEPVSEEEDEEEVLPDSAQFMMVADSVAELRKLAETFAEPEPIVLRRGKKEVIQRMAPRKKNVVLLHERLLCLLKELEPWEGKLQQATRNARIRLRREVDDFIELPEEKADEWDTTDEETESGQSDNEKESSQQDDKPAAKPRLTPSESNSRSSTPIKKEALEDNNEEIDVSQRGRLRKRRIIPNNVEDQYAVKKSRQPLKSDATSATSDPIIVQQGKTELVDYADILRQLKNNPGVKPLLIKTSQGGRTVLTSVMPVATGACGSSSGDVGQGKIAGASTQIVQSLQFSTPSISGTGAGSATLPPPVRLLNPQLTHKQSIIGGPHVQQQGSAKVSQHPTIRTLLSASLSAITGKPVLFPSSTTSAVASAGTGIDGSSAKPYITTPRSESLSQTIVLSTDVKQLSAMQGQVSPQQQWSQQQHVTPQKVLAPSPSPNATPPSKVLFPNTTAALTVVQCASSTLKKISSPTCPPRKIAPAPRAETTTSTAKATKYYAANPNTLPVNVVSQLIATRGAKMTPGKKQNILLIPVEQDGSIKQTSAAGVSQTQRPELVSPGKHSPGSYSGHSSSSSPDLMRSQISPTPEGNHASSGVPKASPNHNQMILPKPQVTAAAALAGMSALPVQPGVIGLQGAQGGFQQGTLITGGLNGNINKLTHPCSTSPPRYPSNETVRTLLDKRKSTEEKKPPPYKFMKLFLNKSKTPELTNFTCIVTQLSTASEPVTTKVKICSETTLSTASIESILMKKPLHPGSSTPGYIRVTLPGNEQNISLPVTDTIALPRSMDVNFDPISGNGVTVATVTQPDRVLAPAGIKTQQCVITSISPAKLNTLLLQTSAAGAKTIPSLIKLPSKAALDSAVKAVVTSVNTSLPTVNIKVPSPTSLPSISPRRNVTKTIQTMKSPIPVAPRVVTQNSGGKTLSAASCHIASTSQLMTLSAIQGQAQGQQVTMQDQGQRLNIQGQVPGIQLPAGVESSIVQQQAGQGNQAGLVQQALSLQGAVALSQGQLAALSHQAPNAIADILGQVSDSQDQASLAESATAAAASLGLEVSTPSSLPTCMVIGKDGKKVLTKFSPHLLITSKGVMQVGYMSPDGMLLSSKLKSISGFLPVSGVGEATTATAGAGPSAIQMSSATDDTPIMASEIVHRETSQSPVVPGQDKAQPVIALNASGNPIGALRVTSVTMAASQPHFQVVSARLGGAAGGSNGDQNTQQGVLASSSALLNPVMSPAIAQPGGMVSPLLGMNLPGSMGVASGVQVTNPLGLQILQAPMAAANLQSSNLLQTISSSVPTTQLVAPMMMKARAPAAANVGLLRKVVTSSKGPLQQTGQQITQIVSGTAAGGASPLLHMPGAGLNIPGVAVNQLQLLSQLSAAQQQQQNTGDTKQLVFQNQYANPSLAALHSQLLQQGQAATAGSVPMPVPTPDMAGKPSVMSGRASGVISPSPGGFPAAGRSQSTSPVNSNLISPQQLPLNSQQVNLLPNNSSLANAVNVQQIQVPANFSQQKSSSTLSQQKLLLFSIGGQLVTGQGVPVTLSNGVLKMLPQGKVKINNQTLTQEQVKQTLTKIADAAASVTVVTTGAQPQQNPPLATTVTTKVGDEGTAAVNLHPSVKAETPSSQRITFKQDIEGESAILNSSTEVLKTLIRPVPVKVYKHSNNNGNGKSGANNGNGQSGTSSDHAYQFNTTSAIKQGHGNVGISNSSDVPLSYTNIVFDHNNMPVKIERHGAAADGHPSDIASYKLNLNSASNQSSSSSVKNSSVSQMSSVIYDKASTGYDNPQEETDSANSSNSTPRGSPVDNHTSIVQSQSTRHTFHSNVINQEVNVVKSSILETGMPILETGTSSIGTLFQTKVGDGMERSYIVRAPLKMNGSGDSGVNMRGNTIVHGTGVNVPGTGVNTHGNTLHVQGGASNMDTTEAGERNLAIDDESCVTEKEAAMNLLTLANQALQ